MKHIHKYIFTTIIIFLLTSILQAAPKAFESLGNELEAMQKDCKQYFQDPQVSKKLQTACKKLNTKVDKAFKVGYPLDVSVESDTASEKKVGQYLVLLRQANENREDLIEVIKSDTIKARRDNNIKYFRFLIDYNKIVLSSRNYEFMKQHHEEFHDNPIYKQAIIREAERKAEKKKAKEEEIAIAKEEAAKKKQRSTKYLSPSSQVTNYRPSSYQGQGQSLSDIIQEENQRRWDRHMEGSNQRANNWRSEMSNQRRYRQRFERKMESLYQR